MRFTNNRNVIIDKNEGNIGNIALTLAIVALIFIAVISFLTDVAPICDGTALTFTESEGNTGRIDSVHDKITLTFPCVKEAMMPAEDYIPRGDFEFQAWLVNFLSVANANLATLGLVVGDITPVTTNQTNFNTAIPDVVTKKAAYETSVENKALRRKQTADSVRVVVRKIQANPAVANSLKANLGITVRDVNPSPVVPVPPSNLTVTGYDTGTNALSWKKNGNKPGTLYVVEVLKGAASVWTLADVVTATKFEHKGQQPGVRAVYRVRARRGTNTSDPSNEASVYAE